MNRDGPPQALRAAGVPSFSFPENAVRALGRAISWAERREKPVGRLIRPEVDAQVVGRLVAGAMERSAQGWITTDDAEALLAATSLPNGAGATPEEAAAAFRSNSGALQWSRSRPPSTRATLAACDSG